MEALLAVVRLMLAGVFLVAGAAKLADRAGSRQAVLDFGLPRTLAQPLGLLVPIGEIVVGLALLPALAARPGAALGFLLLAAFVGGMGFNLARGRHPDCHCFGQLHSAPIGGGTLLRSAFLAALALCVAWAGPGDSLPDLIGRLAGNQTVALLVSVPSLLGLAVLGWLWLQALRQQGRLLLRIEAVEAQLADTLAAQEQHKGLPVGLPAPEFTLAGLDESVTALADLRRAGRPVMLAFLSPGCSLCQQLIPDLAGWASDYADRLTIGVLSQGEQAANREMIEGAPALKLLLQADREVAHAYGVQWTPSAVVVRADGAIGGWVAEGPDAIRAMVTGLLTGALPLRTAPPSGNGHQGPPRPGE